MFWYKGKLSELPPAVPASNRGMYYGDGLFETIRVWKGIPLWLSSHLERLNHGAQKLGFRCDKDEIADSVNRFIRDSGLESARLRISLYRDGQGYFQSDSEASFYFAELKDLPESLFPFKIFKGGVCREQKSLNTASVLKSTSSIIQVLAAREAAASGWEEGIMLNTSGRVAEAVSANLFVLYQGQWFSPPDTEGALPGITRKHLLRFMQNTSVPCREEAVTISMLNKADEVIITNSIRGIAALAEIGDNRYAVQEAARLAESFRKAAMEFS